MCTLTPESAEATIQQLCGSGGWGSRDKVDNSRCERGRAAVVNGDEPALRSLHVGDRHLVRWATPGETVSSVLV